MVLSNARTALAVNAKCTYALSIRMPCLLNMRSRFGAYRGLTTNWEEDDVS